MASMGGRPPSDVAHFLEGLEFPASKEELVTCVEDNEAPQEVIDILDQLPDQNYSSITDIIFRISLVE